ncbi:LysR substrate-binding domain-containing protein [Azospirillum picis]|uniref:DNA-binding transcriptional LysR family regulator n=1 Tax=Azospirillum picis TaxID=488438 RepID=A0ABU0MP69_9PROT|nr:LysR substrate-binding domain-containing protein [Azospirillum picis]MBP2301817.1 DNA-binding transcriptional LysR family regulator [Azospirillum picis]MDQ0535008.1 DNA-binding transcriptional LysR family regulator [Azospirillum picis]
MINPRQIEAFRAVMLTGGITAAAELLNISQPAVSRLISDLQYALKLTLFERRGARIAPTSEAMSLYQVVDRAFVGLELIEQTARDLTARRSGTLRVAAMPALGVGFLPRYVARFLAERPRVDIALRGSTSPIILDWVATGQCEIGFAHTPIDHAAVLTEKIHGLPAVAILPPGHPLADRDVLRPKDFEGESFISTTPPTLLRYRIDTVFADHDVSRVMRVETQLTMNACAMVAAGHGVSIVDPFTAREYVPHGLLVRPFEPFIGFDIAVLRSAQVPLSMIAEDFLAGFLEEVTRFRDGLPGAGAASADRPKVARPTDL